MSESLSEPGEASASFEESLEKLARVVGQLESGGLGLSASIAAYEEGVGLLRRLHDELTAVEARVRVLVRIAEDGSPVFEDLPDPGAEDGRDRPRARTTPGRTRRRQAAIPPPALPGMDESAEDS
jgi:exodeoxyribonuclease VII small subunit